MAGTDDKARVTRASSAYGLVRDEIISAALPPGSRLQIRALCDRLEIGLTPMREALSRLSSEGLVTQQDRRGFTVAPLGEEDLSGLTNARCWLDEIGLRLSIANGGPEWEEQLLLAFHRLKRTPRHLDASSRRNPAWEVAHRTFHNRLLGAASSAWLDRFCTQMFDAAERYRNVARIAASSRLPQEKEHEDIMDAALDRDLERATELLRAHYLKTEDSVRKFLSMPPRTEQSKAALSLPVSRLGLQALEAAIGEKQDGASLKLERSGAVARID